MKEFNAITTEAKQALLNRDGEAHTMEVRLSGGGQSLAAFKFQLLYIPSQEGKTV